MITFLFCGIIFLLISLTLCLYKLYNINKDLQSIKEYNSSLEILYDNIKGFKHDFQNIISTLSGFLDNNDLKHAKSYCDEIKKECQLVNDLSILNPKIINNSGIYSLLNGKYFKASSLGIAIDMNLFLDFSTLNINIYKFSRILGILLDNAIEAASTCDKKIIKLDFRRENKNNRAIISIKNTYCNKNIDIDTIFNKGYSEKKQHSGIGLWQVRNYIKNSKNLNLYTNKNNHFFIQQLEIYDDIKSVV